MMRELERWGKSGAEEERKRGEERRDGMGRGRVGRGKGKGRGRKERDGEEEENPNSQIKSTIKTLSIPMYSDNSSLLASSYSIQYTAALSLYLPRHPRTYISISSYLELNSPCLVIRFFLLLLLRLANSPLISLWRPACCFCDL